MLISVIVPVYNAEKFLNKSIESVINQSYESIELILINDGSTDSSEAICNNYAFSDNRIKVISQINSGPAAARNTGISNASGEFIFFLDADDFIEKDALKILVAKFNQYRPDLVMANFSKLENNGKIIKQNVFFRPDGGAFKNGIKELSKNDLLAYVRHFLKHPSNHLISYCWARLYKTSIIKNNGIFANADMCLFEDFVFNLDYLKYSNKIVFVNEALYTYTMHNHYVSASMAIINSRSLLYDMGIFKSKVNECFRGAPAGLTDTFNINKEIGHALIHYLIIFLTRSCRQINNRNRKVIYGEIKKIVNASIIRESLCCYSPSKGNSRILPVLIKFRLINLMMLVCEYKSYKRYGKPQKI